MPKGEFEVVAPEDIRSEKLTFKDMIVRCLDRIHIVASQMAERNTRASIAAYEESIAALHCFLAAYYDQMYLDKVLEIEDALIDERASKDMVRFNLLRQWLMLITQNLGKVGLLPPIDIILDMTTQPQKKAEEEEKFRATIRRLLKEDRKEEMLKWIENGGRLPQINLKPITIADVIAPEYIKKSSSEEDALPD